MEYVHVLDADYSQTYSRDMDIRETLQAILDRTGWKQEDLAERLDTTQATVSRWFKGSDPRGASRDKIRELHHTVTHGEIRSEDVAALSSSPLKDRERLVPVVGYIGAGAEVLPVDDHARGDGLDYVEVPFPVAYGTVCAIVRGESMLPMFEDGDLIGYIRRSEDPSTLLGKRCVVKLDDGRLFIKRLKRGSEPGLFTLVSANANDIEDVTIEWAARFSFSLPAEEWHALSSPAK